MCYLKVHHVRRPGTFSNGQQRRLVDDIRQLRPAMCGRALQAIVAGRGRGGDQWQYDSSMGGGNGGPWVLGVG